jgi:lysine-specific demethylase 8
MIARIRPQGPEDLHGILRAFQPVLIEGLFDAEGIRAIDSLGRFVEQFGEWPVRMVKNYAAGYFDSFKRAVRTERPSTVEPGAPAADEEGTASTLRAFVTEAPTDVQLTELPWPETVVHLLGPPHLLAAVGIRELQTGYFPKAGAAGCLWFLARAGAASDLHTDWDGHHLLHHQVFGRKRWTLFPPSSGPRLGAVDIYGTVALRTMGERERREVLAWAGGDECIVEPGETLYVPPYHYHHVDYLDAALGVALRLLGPGEDLRLLTKRLHRSNALQCLFASILEAPGRPRSGAIVAALDEASRRTYASPAEKYFALEELASALCGQHALRVEPWWLTAQELLAPMLSTNYYAEEREDRAAAALGDLLRSLV